MGRVLLEATFAEKPIIASRVDGIPHYVTDGETGTLFTSENVSELSSKIRDLLENPDRSKVLVKNAKKFALENYTSEHWAKFYTEMVEETLGHSR